MSYLDDPRVLFAAERTLLAWNRTSLALIALGFLIERSGLLIEILSPQHINGLSHLLTFWAGLIFIFTGGCSAIFASRQYLIVLKTLHDAEIPASYNAYWGIIINTIVALLAFILVTIFYLDRL